ncbi:MAG: hypothetical protein JWO44_697 [Bacteroidetes bacterium]|nr:hypothetical protein [Bacteroidota bacterium]
MLGFSETMYNLFCPSGAIGIGLGLLFLKMFGLSEAIVFFIVTQQY